MKKRFTEEQIIKVVNRHSHGESAKELAREIGVSEHTIYTWKKRYKGMTVSEAKKLRDLEQENTRLKKMVADMALDIAYIVIPPHIEDPLPSVVKSAGGSYGTGNSEKENQYVSR